MPRRSSSAPRSTADRASTLSAVISIRRIVQALRLASQRTQAQAGVSAAQLFVLQQLGTDDGLSLNELAARTFTDRSSVAAVVDRLSARGFVERAVHPVDRRRAAVHLTPAGRRVLVRAPNAPTTILVAALTKLAPSQRAAMATSLRRLTEALGVADTPAPMLFSDSANRPPSRRARRPK
ncbi:MAG: MarR family winged helix-turn-helix transcriptional regulator [Gemmatimonadaceae bacterium]